MAAQLPFVRDALMRFQSNQFRFCEGEMWVTSAVFALTSFMNHSCSPNAFVEPRWVQFQPVRTAAL